MSPVPALSSPFPTARVPLALTLLGCAALAQSTTRVSVDSSGLQSNGTSGDPAVAISADGRFSVFNSAASNLVAGDTNLVRDVFVHDLLTGATERVNVDSTGAQANGDTQIDASISGDGRYVAFDSLATNLVPGDTNGVQDVFVRDRLLGTTTRVSVGAGGVQGNAFSQWASISSDGRYVAFASAATNLVTGDTNSSTDVFVRDLVAGTTVRASVTSAGAQVSGNSTWPRISLDGRCVAFRNVSAGLVAGDTNGVQDVFVRDLIAGTTERASVDSGGVQGNAASAFDGGIALSGDGRYVAFESGASNLVAGDTNAAVDVFLRDRQVGTTERVSVGAGAAQGNSVSRLPSISYDGRFVAFYSLASNLVASDFNSSGDVFVRDRASPGTTTLASLTTGGAQGGAQSATPAISASGRFVAFSSLAGNLVAGDNNGVQDVFVRDRGTPPSSPGYAACFGDLGGGALCPCLNNGPSGGQAGCLNSLGSAGRLLGAGSPSVFADTFVLSGTGMPNSSALYFQGTDLMGGGSGVPFGDGLRCVAGTVIRLGTKTNSGGASQFPAAGDPSVSVKGACTVGVMRTYQVWYRNTATFCTPDGFNLTNAWVVFWTL
jgi:Tol biopolymer transport system component